MTIGQQQFDALVEQVNGANARLEAIEDKLDDLEDLIREGGTRFGEDLTTLHDAPGDFIEPWDA